MYKLIIEDDEGKTWVVNLVRDEVTIGRKDGNTIRLTERNVSRKHARLVKSNGSVFIEDLSSYNGVKVNGERIGERAPVAEGDRIQIGDYQLALKLDRTAADGDDRTTPFQKDDARHTAMVEAPRAQQNGSYGHAGNGVPLSAAPLATAPANAPTSAIPQLALGSQPMAMPLAGDERPARLVVVSSNFAGREFRLDKPQAVLGRTNDNDVCIDHRSISRHHAKVLREGGRYQIQDLGSANGVRVNGEEYGKVELRKGDLIDLGHVRLRFVAPSEDFVFARDAKVVDVDESSGASGGKKTLIAGGIFAAVLLVGVVAVVAFRSPTEKSGTAPGAAGTASAAEANATVDRALKDFDWDRAIAAADQGLAANPGDDILRDKKARAESEKKVAPIYDEYDRAVKSDDTETAVAKYAALDAKSVYRDRAQSSWIPVRRNYVTAHLAKARALQASGRCEEAKQQVEKVLVVDETNAEAQEVARRCGQQAAAVPAMPTHHAAHTPPPAPVAPARPAHEAKPDAPAAPAPVARAETPRGGGGGVDALVGSAQDDYVRGQYGEAIDQAHKALKIDAGNSKAWRIVGASSCFLKDKAGAASAWNKLGNMDRQFLKYVCGRNAITIP